MSENAFSWQDDVDMKFRLPRTVKHNGPDRHCGTHFYLAGSMPHDDYPPGPVRSLKDMTDEERRALEERYGCGFTATSCERTGSAG